jgi:acetyl-CoA C-acetyltransferase
VAEAALVVESMTRNPRPPHRFQTGLTSKTHVGSPAAGINMIQTAENLAKKYSIAFA